MEQDNFIGFIFSLSIVSSAAVVALYCVMRKHVARIENQIRDINDTLRIRHVPQFQQVRWIRHAQEVDVENAGAGELTAPENTPRLSTDIEDELQFFGLMDMQRS